MLRWVLEIGSKPNFWVNVMDKEKFVQQMEDAGWILIKEYYSNGTFYLQFESENEGFAYVHLTDSLDEEETEAISETLKR